MALRKMAFAALALLAFSCNDGDNEDLTQTVNKNGAIESAISVSPIADGRQVLTTTHKVWLQGNTYKTVEYHDTLPGLGTTIATAENSDGDTRTVPVEKEYEIYITVK